MKKTLMPVVFALATALVLTGCGKKAEAGSSSSKPITITVWESDKGPDEFIQKAGEAYTKLHPNVTVKYVHVELGDAAGQIALDGPAGVGPDLFAAPHDKLGELVSSGHVAPTVDAAAVSSKVLGACSQALTSNGTMYGYPVSAETYALFYNKDLISENDLPKTWDDLAAFSKKFNAANTNKYGFVMDVGNAYYTIVFTTADGNRLFGKSGTDVSSSYLNAPAAVKGMEFFQKTLRPALNVPAADLTTSVADGAFAAGNAAMHITGLWNVKPFQDAGLNFGVAALPALPGDSKPCASFSGTRAMFVSAYVDEAHQAAAADFAEFLLTEEMQQLRFNITGSMPSINVKVDSPYMPGFIAQLDYAFPMPSIPQMGAFWEAMGNASKNIWDGANVQKELDAANASILGL